MHSAGRVEGIKIKGYKHKPLPSCTEGSSMALRPRTSHLSLFPRNILFSLISLDDWPVRSNDNNNNNYYYNKGILLLLQLLLV